MCNLSYFLRFHNYSRNTIIKKINILSILLYLSIIFSQNQLDKLDFVLGFFPEYDQSNVLVMLQYNIPEKLLPYKAEIKLPHSITSIFEFQTENNHNGLVEIPLKTNGFVELNINNSQYYCQFYVDLAQNDIQRNFEYTFESNVDLIDFHVVIQRPLGAKKYKSSLVEPEEFNDEYNLTYNRKFINKLNKNEKFKISFSYVKESSLTTLEILDKILTDHNHSEGDEHNHNHDHPDIEEVNNDLLDKFNNTKYYSLIFGFLLIFILSLIFILNDSNSKQNTIKKENICPNCNKNVGMDLTIKYCTKCGENINVS